MCMDIEEFQIQLQGGQEMDNMDKNRVEMCGVPDSATDKDWLKMTPQYTGITEFIKRCQTPMTIAIQGNWGVGKTSAMMNIERTIKAERKNPCLWFKTWQFSALKDKSNIILEFMLTLLDKLGEILIEIRVIHTLGLLLKACERNVLPKGILAKNVEVYLNQIVELSYDIEQLDAILQMAWDSILSSNQTDAVIKKWKEGLEALRDELAEKYGIPVKEIDDAEMAKNAFGLLTQLRNTMVLVKKSKRNIAQFSVAALTGALGVGAEFLMPAGFGKWTSDMIGKTGDKISEMLCGEDVPRGGTDDGCCTDNQSNTLFLVKICNEINHIIQEILKYYGENDKSRICIFVDDLDRLRPEIALELLEGMKNFVEYKQSVFILAIDKAVIDQGLRSKYDEKFLMGERDQGTGRNRADKFFDKIIQVPFTLPEKSYDISAYMKELLEETEEQMQRYVEENKPTSEAYAKLLQELDIYNPRSIKRCFNLQALYDCMSNVMIKDEDRAFIESNKEWYRLCYFAVTILQIENSKAYYKMLGLVLMSQKDEGNVWDEIKACCKEAEEQQIEIVFRRFEQAAGNIGMTGAEGQVRKWLSSMLTSSNYNHTFSERQIYIQRLREIIEEIESDNVVGLDLTKFKEHFKKEDKELAEGFGAPIKERKENYCLIMGWGALPRPYIILGLNGKDQETALAGIDGFEKYNSDIAKKMANNKNYYLIDDKELSIYISPNEKKSKECIAVLKNLGYLSAE